MSNESKYYNLDSPGKRWSKEEFAFAVLALESLPRASLLEMLQKFRISFTGGNESVDDESLISVLLDDVSKEQLLVEVRKRHGH